MTGQVTTSTTSTISPLSRTIKDRSSVVLKPLWLRNTEISKLRYTLRIEVEGGERWVTRNVWSVREQARNCVPEQPAWATGMVSF